jgi:hypothetical protein
MDTNKRSRRQGGRSPQPAECRMVGVGQREFQVLSLLGNSKMTEEFKMT